MNFPLKSMSVLIVDDNPTNIQVLVGTLRDICRARVHRRAPGRASRGIRRPARHHPPGHHNAGNRRLRGVQTPEDNPRTMHIPIMFTTSKSTSCTTKHSESTSEPWITFKALQPRRSQGQGAHATAVETTHRPPGTSGASGCADRRAQPPLP